MNPESPIPPYLVRVNPDWIDHNGNMGEAYYVLTFGQAINQCLPFGPISCDP